MNAITRTTSVAALVALGLALTAWAAESPKQAAPAGAAEEPAPAPVFTRDSILATMRKANDYRLTQEQGYKWYDKPGAQGDNWVGGTYYTGVMALYRATEDKAVLDQAVAWTERGKWAPGREVEIINNLTCCQTYLELYAIETNDTRIAKTREFVDRLVADGFLRLSDQPRPRWCYDDEIPGGPCWIEGAPVNVPVKFANGAIKELRFTPMCSNLSFYALYETPVRYAMG